MHKSYRINKVHGVPNQGDTIMWVICNLTLLNWPMLGAQGFVVTKVSDPNLCVFQTADLAMNHLTQMGVDRDSVEIHEQQSPSSLQQYQAENVMTLSGLHQG